MDLKARAETDWQIIGPLYAQFIDDIRTAFLHPVLEEMALACTPRAATLLDYGCGDGSLVARMRERFQQFGLVDVSSYMLECARAKMGVAHVETFLPDAFEHTASSYDIAINSLVLTTLADEKRVMRMFEAIHDHLEEGGQLILASTHPCFTFSALDHAPYAEAGAAYPVVLCPGFEIVEHHRPLANLINLICQASFSLCECREVYDDIGFYEERGLDHSRYAGKLPVFLVLRARRENRVGNERNST